MKIKLLLLLSLTVLQANAQNAFLHFSGQVTDAQTKQPVNGATVTLTSKVPAGSITDEKGRFNIARIPPGEYLLKVSYIGYQPFQQSVFLTADVNDYHVSLENIGLFVQPVEITSLRAGKDAPFAKTELSREILNKENLGQDLPFLLNQLPSVVTTSDAGAGVGYTSIWIRGSDATRINVTINGIPVNDAESAGTYWVDLPDIVSSAGSIQVQRGVGTSTNGAGAFGATINVSTNEFFDKPYASINSSFGSFNTWKNTVSAGSGLLNDHFTIDARLSKISSDGYIDRASSSLESFYVSAAYLNKKTAIRLNVFSGKEKTYQAWNGVPEDSLKTHRTYNGLGLMPDGTYYNNQTDNYEQDYYQFFINHEISSHLNFNAAAFLTRGIGYYEEYKIQEPYSNYNVKDPVFGNDTLSATDLIRRLYLDNYFYGGIFSLNYNSSKLNWNLGGGWNQYDGKHYGKVDWAQNGGFDKNYQWYYNLAHKWDFNIYWKGEMPLTGMLKAFADLQYRHIKYDINGFDANPGLIQRNTYNFFNPKIGLNYALSKDDRLYASYAIGNKEPNRDDFEANQTETPKPETMGDLELGYDHTTGVFSVHANAYYMDYKNQLVLTGKINDVGAYTRSNIPQSYRLGLELSGNVKFARIFSLAANATVSRNKIGHFTEYIDNYDNGKQNAVYHGQTDISFSPALTSGFTLSAAPAKGLEVSLIGKYVSRRYLDNTSNNDRSLSPYFVNNMQVNYIFKPEWVKEIDLSLLVNNIFSVNYLSNGYSYTYIQGGKAYTQNNFFPQAPVNFLLGVSVRL